MNGEVSGIQPEEFAKPKERLAEYKPHLGPGMVGFYKSGKWIIGDEDCHDHWNVAKRMGWVSNNENYEPSKYQARAFREGFSIVKHQKKVKSQGGEYPERIQVVATEESKPDIEKIVGELLALGTIDYETMIEYQLIDKTKSLEKQPPMAVQKIAAELTRGNIKPERVKIISPELFRERSMGK